MVVDAARAGTRSAPRAHRVTAEAVARLAKALGWPAGTGWEGPVPPTFAVTLKPDAIPGLTLPPAGVVHGEQTFEYGEPIRVGDVITVTAWVADWKTRRGARGVTTFVTVASEGVNQRGALAFRARARLVVSEGEEGA